MSAARILASVVLVAAAIAVSACGGGRSTPGEALQSLRSAMEIGDGVRAFQLHDADCRAFHLQRIRTVRARLESGEPERDVLLFDDQSAPMFLDGTAEDAAGRIILSRSELASSWEWLRDATVIDEVLEDVPGGQPRARLQMRGADGTESEIFFVKEPEGWSYDQYRLRQEQMKRR